MNKVDFLILGGGIAGTTAAEEIRSNDQNSSIAIITQEADRLYSRVGLPHFLCQENTLESLFLRNRENYSEKNIQLITNLKVLKVDTVNKIVKTAKNQSFNYNKLLIATGGKVNQLSIPGNKLPEIVYLRTLEDAKKIKEIISISQNSVVVGGGFIGIGLVEGFITNGLKTTMIVREKSILENLIGENSGKLISQILKNKGVTVLTEAEVTDFIGDKRLLNVKLSTGSNIPADIVGIGIGINPDIDYLKDSGLKLNKGIITNEFLETSVANVWAAGDIAEFYDPLFEHYNILGNWANASLQGRMAGINMVGVKNAFETVSLYSINFFNNNLSFLGDTLIDNNTEKIERVNLEDKKIARYLLRNDIIVGASLINLPTQRGIISRLIKDKIKITESKSKLADPNFDLSTL